MEGKLEYISYSKKGILRDRNQDRIQIINNKDFYFFAIFDGVSSLSESYKLIKLFKQKFYSKIYNLNHNGNNLDKLLFDTNVEVSKCHIEGSSTISVVFINKNESIVKYINIGDSRIYAFTNQFLDPITTDDKLKDNSNVITKYIGNAELVLDDFQVNSSNIYFNYLLCTDGFHKLMEENIKDYFITLNFKNIKNIKKKISSLQRMMNYDDSSYIIIKNEI